MQQIKKMSRSEKTVIEGGKVKPPAMFRLFRLGLMFLTAFQPSVPVLAQSLTARDRLQEGIRKYKSNDNPGALDEAQWAIAGDSENWKAYQLAGYAYYKMGNPGAARAYCQKSLQLRPDNLPLQTFVDKCLSTPEVPLQLPEGFRNPASAFSAPNPILESPGHKKEDPHLVVGIVLGTLAVLTVLTGIAYSDGLKNINPVAGMRW